MKRAKKILITGAFLFMAALQVGAQIPNSLFFMPGVPQSNRINPAIQPGCGLYLGMPALSPLRMQISSSSLAYQDVIYYNSDGVPITAFHPDGNKEAFLANLKDVNYVLGNLGTSILSMGFRAGKSFISFDLTTRVDANLYYPKGLFELPIIGLTDGDTRSFNGMGVDLTGFIETSLGWSRKDFIIPNLDLGIRAKFLSGLANINTARSVIEITPSNDTISFNSDIEMNIAVPAMITISESDDSLIPDIEMDESYFENPSYVDIAKDVLLDNSGFGVDIGLNYQPIPQLMVSASVLDLGYINWNNTVTGGVDFAYDFIGINVNPFTGVDTAFIQEMLDSVKTPIDVGQPYRSKLNTKLFVGASYYPIEKIGFGVLSRTDFLGNEISQQFTGTANMTTGRFLNLSLSYTYMTASPKNFGAGLSINAGPFNLYVISDNIISGALWPTETRSVNLWFGMNLCFGYRVAKKTPPPKDRPLIL